MGIDILGVDILGIDILGIDIVALPPQKNRLNETVLLITQNTCLDRWVRIAKNNYNKIITIL